MMSKNKIIFYGFLLATLLLINYLIHLQLSNLLSDDIDYPYRYASEVNRVFALYIFDDVCEKSNWYVNGSCICDSIKLYKLYNGSTLTICYDEQFFIRHKIDYSIYG